jgi:bifunctional DNase/RNase
MKPVDVLGLNLETGSGTPLVVLREQDAPHRLLPIFIGGREAVAIALALSGETPPRPLTHDLLAALIDSLDAHVDHIEVTEVRDGTFLAELVVAGPHGGVNLDSRPSDAIALALRVDAPMFASDAVLAEAGALVPDLPDEGTIDEDVDRFRAFLDDVDPSEFEKRQGPGEPPDQGGR